MIWKNAYRLVDFFRKTNAIKAFNLVLQTEWLSLEELNHIQFERLKKLLVHCSNNVPYYNELFKKIKFKPEDMKDTQEIEKIPVLTKEIVRANYDSFKAKDFEKYQPRKHQTGGSTGKPFVSYFDYWSHSYLWGNNFRAWKVVSDYKVGDKIIINAHGSLMPKQSSFKRSVYFLLQHADWISNYHNDYNSLIQAWDRINKSKAILMYGASSSLYLIAKFAQHHHIKNTSGLKAIYTTSDMLYPDQRKTIEEVFSAPVLDSYGCPEAGIITFECEKQNGFHINQESVLIEIADKDDEGKGRILSTSLFNYAFPFVRYDTGDVGKITNEKCDCGRSLPRITELSGRIRDFIVLPDGRHIHGAFFNRLEILYKSKWIDEYQIIQESEDKLILKININKEPSEHEKNEIISELHKALSPSLKIDFDFSGIQKTKGGKFRLVHSHVKTKWET